MKKTDFAYMAGIIDGEGCLRFSRHDHRTGMAPSFLPRVDIANTNEIICRRLQFAFGGSVYVEKRKAGKKKCWRWVAQGEMAYDLLKLLFPYLVIKKAQALLLIESWEGHTKYHKRTPIQLEADEIRIKKIKELNRRGDDTKLRDESKQNHAG